MKTCLFSDSRKSFLSLATLGVALVDTHLAVADVRLCQANSGRTKGTVVSVSVPESCPANSTQILYHEDLFGSGTTNLRVLAGRTKSIAAYEQTYNNCTVAVGATLTMPSGSILRCNGDFINNGFVTVGEMSRGGSRAITALSTFELEGSSPGQSIGGLVARHGVVASTTTDGVDGPSFGSSSFPASAYFFPGQIGGGGGGAGLARHGVSNMYGGNGGGAAVILVRGNFENAGVISANGGDSLVAGGGGGGGGVLVIGVKGTLTNTATISARGGAGGAGAVNESAAPPFAIGGGGGGTGGLVHYIAGTLVLTDGVTDVTGGAGGVASGTASGAVAIRAGGGSGGAGVSYGGSGGSVNGAGLVTQGQDGFDGFTRSTTSNNIEKVFGVR